MPVKVTKKTVRNDSGRVTTKPKVGKHGRRYDWKKIFGKQKSTLRRNTHYNGMEHSFVVYIRRAARKFGYKVSVHVGEGSVTITVVGKKRPCKHAW